MTILLIIGIIALSFILIKSADFIVISLKKLSLHSKASTFTLSAILLALATSFPELSVAITSSLDKSSGLSFGNVLGANIANISLVVGAATLITGKVKVHGSFLKEDVFFALLFGLTPLIMILDKTLGRVDGLVLILFYLAYATGFFTERRKALVREHMTESLPLRFFRKIEQLNGSVSKDLAKLFAGVAVLLLSANMIVQLAQNLAAILNIPLFLIGLILISLGTTLPELAFSIRSLEDNEPTMFFGNALGSVIANSTLILGTAALIYPIQITGFSQYLIAIISFIVIFLTFWLFIRTKMMLTRLEGGILLALYIIFATLEFIV